MHFWVVVSYLEARIAKHNNIHGDSLYVTIKVVLICATNIINHFLSFTFCILNYNFHCKCLLLSMHKCIKVDLSFRNQNMVWHLLPNSMNTRGGHRILPRGGGGGKRFFVKKLYVVFIQQQEHESGVVFLFFCFLCNMFLLLNAIFPLFGDQDLPPNPNPLS